MQFLKELMAMSSDDQINEAKKAKTAGKAGMLSMIPINSFSAGNMVFPKSSSDEEEDECVEESDSKMKITGKAPKVRNQQLHNVLSGRKGGAMYDAKRDYVRAKEKQKQRRGDDE